MDKDPFEVIRSNDKSAIVVWVVMLGLFVWSCIGMFLFASNMMRVGLTNPYRTEDTLSSDQNESAGAFANIVALVLPITSLIWLAIIGYHMTMNTAMRQALGAASMGKFM